MAARRRAPELAERAGIDARYAREWLEQQAVAAVLEVDDVARRAGRPPVHAAGRPRSGPARPGEPGAVAPLARFVVGTARTMPRLLEAYRTGGGVDWADYGPDVVEAQEGINRPQFHHLVGDWIGALPDIAARLARRRGSRRGRRLRHRLLVDRHRPGASRASRSTASTSTKGRSPAPGPTPQAAGATNVSFLHADAADAEGAGRYDLVTIFEAVHDMARPAEVLATARRLLAPGGAVLIADERVAETFTAPGDETERLFYAYSVVACLANGLVDQPSIGTGTVLRPAALEAIAREAGFSGFTILPTEHDAFRFYRLDP